MQTPLEEVTERVAETLPGLAAAAKAVALDNHAKMLEDHRRRVHDSHKWMMQQSGGNPSNMAGSDDMGGVVVTGDIHVAEPGQVGKILDRLGTMAMAQQAAPVQQPAQPVTSPQQPIPQHPSAWSRAWPWLLAVATGLGGAGVAATIGDDKPAEAPRYDVEHWKPE